MAGNNRRSAKGNSRSGDKLRVIYAPGEGTEQVVSPSMAKKALLRDGLRAVEKDMRPGLQETDYSVDGPRKRFLAAVEQEAEASRLLLTALHRYYPDLMSLEQLPTMGARYTDAVPILLTWIASCNNPALRASIATALGQPWIGRPAVEAIAAGISKTLDSRPGKKGPTALVDIDIQVMINALLKAATGSDLMLVANVGLDPRLGELEWKLLVSLLGRRHSKQGIDALKILAHNDDIKSLIARARKPLHSRH